MNLKALSLAAIVLGALLAALGFYQINQYFITQATASATMKQYEQLFKSPELSASGQETIQQLTAGIAEATNALSQAILVDFLVGVVLLAGGIAVYPAEKK